MNQTPRIGHPAQVGLAIALLDINHENFMTGIDQLLPGCCANPGGATSEYINAHVCSFLCLAVNLPIIVEIR